MKLPAGGTRIICCASRVITVLLLCCHRNGVLLLAVWRVACLVPVMP